MGMYPVYEDIKNGASAPFKLYSLPLGSAFHDWASPFVVGLHPLPLGFTLCHWCKGNTQNLCRSTKLRCLPRPAKPPLRPAKPLLRFALRTQPHRSVSRIQSHWFVHASPLPVCRTLRTISFMVPLLFIIIVSRHFARPCGFLYMYLHQHRIPILSSSDPLLGALIM